MLLETNQDEVQPQDNGGESQIVKQNLTGREIEIGQSPFDLAEYAKDANVTRKLYITEDKDIYVEVNVKSKQIDESANK